jgi:hypothetical protein
MAGDYHLQWDSPCIDSGDPNLIYNDPDGTRADMGAYYYDQSGLPQPEISVSTSSLDFDSVLLVEEMAALPLTIYNLGNATLVLYQISANLPVFRTNFESADSLILPGDSLLITVFFEPVAGIGYDDFLSIANNDNLVQVQLHGVGVLPDGLIFSADSRPDHFAVSGPYPNPFNPSTVIRYQLPVAGRVSLQVYDTAGKLVAELVSGWREAGDYELTFDGSGLPSGIYIANLRAGGYSQVQKLILLK